MLPLRWHQNIAAEIRFVSNCQTGTEVCEFALEKLLAAASPASSCRVVSAPTRGSALIPLLSDHVTLNCIRPRNMPRMHAVQKPNDSLMSRSRSQVENPPAKK